MTDLEHELWPDGATAGTINRHLITPVKAILRIALKERAPMLTRPKGHKAVQPVEIPPLTWYSELRPQLNPSQLAFVITLAMHGRRTCEMLSRKPEHLDVAAGILDLGKTKTGVRQLELEPRALALITAIPGWQKRTWLFGSGPSSAPSFRRDLRAACKRAGLPWYHPHSFRRHMSVTRMLRAGYSVAHVGDAHGMTPEMVTRRYGHLTKRETTAALHAVGGALYDQVFSGGNEGESGEVATVENHANGIKLLANHRAQNTQRTAPPEGQVRGIGASYLSAP